MLIGLDRTIERADRDWSAYLIRTVKDFVVWGMSPSGSVDQDNAEWLMEVLSLGGLTRTGRIIAREVACAASPVNEALIAFASMSKRRPTGNREREVQARRKAEPLDPAKFHVTAVLQALRIGLTRSRSASETAIYRFDALCPLVPQHSKSSVNGSRCKRQPPLVRQRLWADMRC